MGTYNPGDLELKDNPSLHGLALITQMMKELYKIQEKIDSEENELFIDGVNIAIGKIPLVEQCTLRMLPIKFRNKYEGLLKYGRYDKLWLSNGLPGRKVAIKQMKTSLDNISNIWKERDLLICLKHSRICNLIGAFYDRDAFLVMEVCYGNLERFQNLICKQDAVKYGLHLLQAVEWIHENNIIHTDINLGSCLINQNMTLVLSDFNNAIILKKDEIERQLSTDPVSPGYLNQNALENGVYSKGTDMFSVACVMFEMDVKEGLLAYPQKGVTREIYLDAHKNGRISDCAYGMLNVTEGTQRERLEQRALKSIFKNLIQQAISQQQQMTAVKALENEDFNKLVDEAFASSKNPCGGATLNYECDSSKEFNWLGGNDLYANNPALITFCYDEDYENVDHNDSGA